VELAGHHVFLGREFLPTNPNAGKRGADRFVDGLSDRGREFLLLILGAAFEKMNFNETFIIVYNGGVWPGSKNLRAANLNFRAVREVKDH
jgi:hypothetical protein